MSNNDTSLARSERQVGNLVKLDVMSDFPGAHSDWCRSGGCYYTSWLKD